MLERALKEGYVVIQDTIGPGQAAGILALNGDDGEWEKLFLRPGASDSSEEFE